MKKTIKILVTLFILLIILLSQKYLIEKPNQKLYDDQVQKVKLVRVVDGDTLVLNMNGENEKIRLIGMNSPESIKPNHPVECFGREASAHAKEILKNKELFFIGDFSQGVRDRFGRLLGYVLMSEKNNHLSMSNFAETMIAGGYAYEYTYKKNNPYRFQREFQKAEEIAKIEKQGLWADGACEISK